MPAIKKLHALLALRVPLELRQELEDETARTGLRMSDVACPRLQGLSVRIKREAKRDYSEQKDAAP
jgi:hypothetical protein